MKLVFIASVLVPIFATTGTYAASDVYIEQIGLNLSAFETQQMVSIGDIADLGSNGIAVLEAMRPNLGDSASSTALLIQSGDGHLATISQTGPDNLAVIDQAGLLNTGLVQQDGFGLGSLIAQSGSQNFANVSQSGGGHNALVIQQGNGNVAIISQR